MSDESAARNLPAQPTDVDYEAIHDAVMESQRGRWFLQEYARRNRNADTGMLLAALDRIESMLRRQRLQPLPAASSLSELRDAMERAKKNPDPAKPDAGWDGRLADAKGLVRSLEAEIAQLRGMVRPLRDAAYGMREEGVRDRFCADVESCAADLSRRFDALERAAADIFALLREPAAREGANAAPALGQTEPILARAVPAMPQPPEPRPEPVAITSAHLPEIQLSQSEPPVTPSPAATPDVTANRNKLTLDPLLPVVDIRTEPAPQSHQEEAPVHAATELPFVSIGSDVPAAQPAAAASDSAPELPITPTFSPADFMLEPAQETAEPTTPPEPAPPSPALLATPAAEPPAPPPPETTASPAPAKQPPRTMLSADAKSALAPILLLSEEEKIALFS